MSDQFIGCQFVVDGVFRCVKDLDHEGKHVVATQSKAAVWYYRVEDDRLVSEIHVDLKPGSRLDYEETSALWEYLQLDRAG